MRRLDFMCRSGRKLAHKSPRVFTYSVEILNDGRVMKTVSGNTFYNRMANVDCQQHLFVTALRICDSVGIAYSSVFLVLDRPHACSQTFAWIEQIFPCPVNVVMHE